jgi:GT2 family glycosyltransferase
MSVQVAIVILNWNGWRDTLECLKSLEKLESPNVQIIVVDNASLDDSVLQLRSAYPKLDLICNSTNLGFGAGNNVGIRLALESNADLIWLLNNDTAVEANTLSSMIFMMDSDPSVGAVGSVLYDFAPRDRVQVWGGGGINLFTGFSWHLKAAGDCNYLIAASVLLRTDALRAVGLFDERFFYTWEDVDLCFRLRTGGWRLAVADDSRVWHKETVSVGRHSPTRARLFTTGMVMFMRKHSGFALVVTIIGASLKLAIALVRGRWQIIPAIVQGWWLGWTR